MQESVHRCIVFVLLSLVVVSWGFAIVGVNVYLDSGRSIMRDLSTSTDYVWKEGSCGDLFRGLSASRGSGSLAGQAREVCDLARDNGIPPLALKTIINAGGDENRPDGGVFSGDPDRARTFLGECRNELLLKLASLKARYGPYQKRVAYMWFFVPALFGLVGVYYYARSCTPVLFEAGKRRFERLLFGKNKYNEAWQSFINPKKKP